MLINRKHTLSLGLKWLGSFFGSKSLAVFVALCFLAEQAVAFAPVRFAVDGVHAQVSRGLPLDLDVPDSIAVVDDFYRAPGSSKTVVLIRDAHTNESGQLNIARTLDLIFQQERMPYVFLEGGQGDLSLSFLRDKASIEKRKQTGLRYLKKGLFQGSEYFDLTSGHKFMLWGVEDTGLYGEGLKLYRQVTQRRDEAKRYLAKLAGTANLLKSKLFNQALLSFDEKKRDYASGKLSLTQYLTVLGRITQQRNISSVEHLSIKRLSHLHELESAIDFEKANREQAALAEVLSGQKQDELQAENNRFVAQPAQTAEMSGAYIEYLRSGLETGGEHGAFPELRKYFEYLKEMRQLSPRRILDDLKTMETEILPRLIQNQDEQNLWTASQSVELLKRLVEFKLQPDEFLQMRLRQKVTDLAAITGFLNQKILEIKSHQDKALFLEPDLDGIIKKAVSFYNVALQRDKAFLENALQKMDESRASAAVMITGGHHTLNLKSRLRQKNISFIVLTPCVLHETDHARYERLLLSQDTQAQDPKEGALPGESAMSLRPVLAGGRLSIQELITELVPVAASRLSLEGFTITEQNGDALLRGTWSGERPAEMVLAKDLVEMLPPEVIEKIRIIVSTHPKNWPPNVHDGDVGELDNKRTVRIALPKTIIYKGEELDEVEVTGILFNPEDMGKEHYGHGAGLSTENINELTKQGGLVVHFDERGYPVMHDKKYAQLGGHGYDTAKKKYERSRWLLPSRGLRAPIAMGYGKLLGLEKDGVQLGVFISLPRAKHKTRFADAWFESLKGWDRNIAQYLEENDEKDGMRREGVTREEKMLYFNEIVRKFYPESGIEELAYHFGREQRRAMGEDLSDYRNLLFPAEPHRGNMLYEPGYGSIFFDLGGWLSSEAMTLEQAFAYTYMSIDRMLLVVMRADLQERKNLAHLYDPVNLDTIEMFLRGFFYDFEEESIELRKQVSPKGLYTSQSYAYLDNRYDMIAGRLQLGPVIGRSEFPLNRLLKKAMKLDRTASQAAKKPEPEPEPEEESMEKSTGLKSGDRVTDTSMDRTLRLDRFEGRKAVFVNEETGDAVEIDERQLWGTRFKKIRGARLAGDAGEDPAVAAAEAGEIPARFEGERPAAGEWDKSLYEVLMRTQPQVIERIKKLVVNYPDGDALPDGDWDRLHDGYAGENEAMRSVRIKLAEAIEYEGEVLDEILVNGTNFKRADYGKIYVPPWDEGLREENGGSLYKAGFDVLGRPLENPAYFDQLNGHGGRSVKRKFVNSKYLMKSGTVKGPVALGYLIFDGLKAPEEPGNTLGVFLSVKRKNAPKRLGAYIRDIMNGPLSIEAIERLRTAMRLYGRVIRDNPHIPAEPHMGNIAIDVDGNHSVYYYDVGEWLMRKDIKSRAQGFAYRYKLFYDSLNHVFHLIESFGDLQWLYYDRKLDPVAVFLGGYFYEVQNIESSLTDDLNEMRSVQLDYGRLDQVNEDWRPGQEFVDLIHAYVYNQNPELGSIRHDRPDPPEWIARIQPMHMRIKAPFVPLVKLIDEREYGPISAARLAESPSAATAALDLHASLKNYSNEEIRGMHEEELAIFLYGLYLANKAKFDGRHEMALGSSIAAPEVEYDDSGNEVLRLAGFRVGLRQAETIAKVYERSESELKHRYVQGSAVAHVLALRESKSSYQAFAARVDASDIRRSIPKAVSIGRSVYDEGMEAARLEEQLRLLIINFVKIHEVAPEVVFYLDEAFKDQEAVIERILKEYRAQGFVRIADPVESIVVRLGVFGELPGTGVRVDIAQIQANDIPHDLPEAVFQGLMEATLFADPRTRALNFESWDAPEVERLRQRRNRHLEEPIRDNDTYLSLIRGSAPIVVRRRHQWSIVKSVPVEFAIKAMRLAIQEAARSK